ncbi:MAG TPA: type II secretion system F family protein [Desulfohalobiaceae bacterium]|nr:type II secretion system F family protein [Desulfohalobiaceae bacterium]
MEYFYKAATYDGKLQQGKVTGQSESLAVSKLQKQGLVPLEVKPISFSSVTSKSGLESSARIIGTQGFKEYLKNLLTGESISSWRRKPKTKDLILFAEHLSIMLQSGIPLNKSLGLLGELTENKHFSKVIKEIYDQIREGNALWQALENQRPIFPEVFVNMVRAGESGGVLDAVLTKLVDYLKDIQELKEYIVSAMIYPSILGITAIFSIVIMLTLVIPKFAEIFSGLGIDLPLMTQLMLQTGTFMQSKWWIILLLVGFVLVVFKYIIEQPQGKKKWDGLKLRFLLIGPIIQKIEIARFSRTLGTLLNSGVSILTAMSIVKGVVINTILRESLDNVYTDLKQGRMLSVSLEKRRVFPPLAVNMLGVGEESGNLSGMLERVGELYDKDLKSAIKSFTSVFEPCLILLMGLIIGTMVVSMLLAIFSINQLGM